MPAIRTNSTNDTITVKDDTRHAPTPSKLDPKYAGRLTRLRAELRQYIRDDLRTISGRPRAHMSWSPYRYSTRIVSGRGLRLVGWPSDPDHPENDIPFGDPSDIPGGQPVILRLLERWRSGELHFEEATMAERQLAVREPMAVLPGTPLELPAQRSATSYSRNDIGKARVLPFAVNAEGGHPVPRRYKREGAISSKIVLDEVDPEDEVISDWEGEAGGSKTVADSDPIENWSDDEA